MNYNYYYNNNNKECCVYRVKPKLVKHQFRSLGKKNEGKREGQEQPDTVILGGDLPKEGSDRELWSFLKPRQEFQPGSLPPGSIGGEPWSTQALRRRPGAGAGRNPNAGALIRNAVYHGCAALPLLWG